MDSIEYRFLSKCFDFGDGMKGWHDLKTDGGERERR
jgi:hypothetical protein